MLRQPHWIWINVPLCKVVFGKVEKLLLCRALQPPMPRDSYQSILDSNVEVVSEPLSRLPFCGTGPD